MVGDRNGTKVVAAVISGAGLAAPVIGNLSDGLQCKTDDLLPFL